MRFQKPSKIQEKALPLLLLDPATNLIGQSQSGTGKTAAFTLNMLSRVDLSTTAPQALVLAPSRELARQIMGVVQEMGKHMEGLVVTAAIPDPSRRGQRFEGQIIVGTPGTVMDMIRRRLLDARGIKVLVLDEADNMLDQQGLGDQCKRVKMCASLKSIISHSSNSLTGSCPRTPRSFFSPLLSLTRLSATQNRLRRTPTSSPSSTKSSRSRALSSSTSMPKAKTTSSVFCCSSMVL